MVRRGRGIGSGLLFQEWIETPAGAVICLHADQDGVGGVDSSVSPDVSQRALPSDNVIFDSLHYSFTL